MAIRLSDWLTRASSGPVTLALVALLAAFTLFVLPPQAAAGLQAGGGAGSPDTSLWYSPADLYRMAEAYGAAGRQAYVQARVTFDVAWPLVYVAGLTAAASWLGRRAFGPAGRRRLMNLLPIAGGLLDYAENAATSVVMLRYPAATPVVDALAPVFTLAKWCLLAAAFAAIAAALGVLAFRRVRRPGAAR